jgi:hypothetical protein
VGFGFAAPVSNEPEPPGAGVALGGAGVRAGGT